VYRREQHACVRAHVTTHLEKRGSGLGSWHCSDERQGLQLMWDAEVRTEIAKWFWRGRRTSSWMQDVNIKMIWHLLGDGLEGQNCGLWKFGTDELKKEVMVNHSKQKEAVDWWLETVEINQLSVFSCWISKRMIFETQFYWFFPLNGVMLCSLPPSGIQQRLISNSQRLVVQIRSHKKLARPHLNQ
jgi:hypothetical protein